MYINSLHIEKYQILEDLKMEFQVPKDGENVVNIIAGVNGSGKTTLLKWITVLKLNIDILIKNRKQTYDDFIKNIRNKWTKSNLQKAIDSYQNKHNGKYSPYSEMMVYLLSKKMRSL